MDPTRTAETIAQAVATLAALDPEARRPLLAKLYTELKAHGLPEAVAASLQHQLAQAAEGAGAATHTVATGGDAPSAGETKTTKE